MLGPKISNAGVPQGSPVSSVLFKMYCDDLEIMEIVGCSIVGYADNFVILGKETNTFRIVRNVKICVHRVIEIL